MRPVHGGCWWALALATVASVVWAGPAGAETTLTVDAGYAGGFVPGQEVPVRVRVSADRLVRGSLEVAVGKPENGVPVAMAVEVPGGSEKEFLVAAPAGLNQAPDVVAVLRQGDQVLASGQTSVQATSDTELVGILPGALQGRSVPGAAPLAVDAGTARFAAVHEAELEQAPGSLGPLSTLIAGGDELGRLSPGARAGVLRWVEGGGRLLVDSEKGQPVPGLPDAWQPGARGRAGAGLGEVVATGGAAAAGQWSGLVEPSARGQALGRAVGGVPVAGSLATDAGLKTPELGWLVGFLAVYVVVVGPVLFFAVRRRKRPELAWVAVPLVALLFSTGSYVVGRDIRTATQLVHATILASGETGLTATSYLGVFSRGGETARIGFPSGWSNGPFTNVGQFGAVPTVVTRTPDGPEVRLPLEAGQFGVVHAAGPVPALDGGLQVNATADAAGRISGTVHNPTPFRLEEVAVFAGSDATMLGTLDAGERRGFALLNTGQFADGAEFRVWAGPGPGFGGPGPGFGGPVQGTADFGLWEAATAAAGPNFQAPGAVVAAGWTRAFQPEIRLGSRTVRPEGRTLVVAREQVGAAPEASLAAAVHREVVRDPFANGFPGGRPAGTVVRFVLPDGADTSNLVLRSPFGAAELWEDGAWRPASCDPASCQPVGFRGADVGPVVVGCPPGVVPCPPQPPLNIARPFPGGAALTVPPTSVRDGVLYARVQGPVSFGPGVPLTLDRSA